VRKSNIAYNAPVVILIMCNNCKACSY